MDVPIPEFLARHLPPQSTFKLIAGTYSGVSRSEIGTPEEPITKVKMRFKSYPGQKLNFDGTKEMTVGSLDPAVFQKGGNDIVLGMLKTEPEYVIIITMWVPDGSGGQYTAEQNYYFLKNWMVKKSQAAKQFAEVIIALVIPVFGLIWYYKKVLKDDKNNNRLDRITTPRIMRDFAYWLMENGYFRQAFEAATINKKGNSPRL